MLPNPKDLRDLKILIVDDAASMRAIEKDFLHSFGFANIQESPDGKDALKKINAEKFDLILCDWEMPEMSGIALLMEIRQTHSKKTLPFIMITTYGSADDVRAAIKEGINDFITKPLQIKTLKEKVFSVLAI